MMTAGALPPRTLVLVFIRVALPAAVVVALFRLIARWRWRRRFVAWRRWRWRGRRRRRGWWRRLITGRRGRRFVARLFLVRRRVMMLRRRRRGRRRRRWRGKLALELHPQRPLGAVLLGLDLRANVHTVLRVGVAKTVVEHHRRRERSRCVVGGKNGRRKPK
jgi:hypothetical protein